MSFLEPEPDDAATRWSDRLRILVSAFSLLLILAIAPIALVSPMVFDAPGSEKNPLNWASVLGVWIAPFLLIAAFRLSVRGLSVGDVKLGAAILLGVVCYFAIVVGASQLLCHGNTVC